MNYRKYECNLETYYLKALKGFRAPSLTLTPSDIFTYNGQFPLNTTHVFSPTNLPPLANTECNGEMTLYLNNGAYVNVSLAIIVKAAGTILQALVYQRVGNFTTLNMAISGNTVVLTCSPAGTVRWVYRGL